MNKQVDPDAVWLAEGTVGYNIYVDDTYVGAIEGEPGRLEYIVVEMHWEDKGIARAAIREFIELSREHGLREVTTNNATNPAMEHILITEGFEPQTDDIGWRNEI